MSDASGGSAAPAPAPDAGGLTAPGSSPQQDAPQDNEVVVVPGSTSGGGAPQQSVNTKRPAPIFLVKGGDEYVVPEATKNAISSYAVPEGFQQEGAREDSFMFSLGIYCVPIGVVRRSSAENKAFFKCMVGACIKSGKTVPCKKGNKSNVNKHFREKHDLRGCLGKEREERAQTRQGNIVSAMAAATTFGVGARRVKELQAAKQVVEKLLPFTFYSRGEMFKEMMATHGGNTTYPELPPKRVKHLLVELYCATKKAVLGDMLQEVRRAPLPILHHMIDIWTDKPSGRKFLGVHLFYVTANFELRQALISIKRYRPDQDALGEAKAAEVLLEIFEAVLHEFGLRPSDLASGTTDSGSDVKSVSVNGLHPKYGVLWNWCCCHLMVKAAEDAFGTHPDPQKSKNPEARKMLKNVIGMVGTLHKSPNLTTKFEDLQVDLLGEILKIPNQAPQRWLTLVRTLERVIRLWHVLRKLHSDAGKTFPLEEGDNKDCILQLYSLLQPLSSVTRDGQYGGVPMMAEIYMKFGKLKVTVLNTSADLKVFDIPPLGEDGVPDREEQKQPLPHTMVAPDDLHPVVQKARKELCRALVSRFYGRVWDDSCLDPSMFCDAACLLTPPFSEGNYLSALKLEAEEHEYLAAGSPVVAPTTDEEVQEKLDGVWAEIKKRAITAVKTAQSRAAGEDGSHGTNLFKRARTSGAGSSRRKNNDDDFSMFGRNEVAPSQNEGDVDLLEEEISSEIMRYKGVFMKSTDLPPTEVLNYWSKVGKQMFPSLKYVAQQTLGVQASAAQVERDFSHCGLFSTGNRSRVEEYWLEMVMFLKGNYQFIPEYKDIPNIASKDIRKCLPAKFTGRNDDLLKAEMALDPLSNTTPPYEDDIGVGDDG